MKNELKTLLSSTAVSPPETKQEIKTTFNLSRRANRSVLEPFLGEQVEIIGTVGRFGTSPDGPTMLITNASFIHGDLTKDFSELTSTDVHHAWTVVPTEDLSLTYPLGSPVGGLAEVIMYSKKNGDLSYGFKLLPLISYWTVLQQQLLALCQDIDKNKGFHQTPESFVTKAFIKFNRSVKQHKNLITHHGLGLNKCNRISADMEKKLTKVAKNYSFDVFARALFDAVKFAENFIEENKA